MFYLVTLLMWALAEAFSVWTLIGLWALYHFTKDDD